MHACRRNFLPYLFHGNLEHPENSAGRRLISLLSPKQNLILFTKGKIPFTSTQTKTICRRLREQLDIPILIVSARRDDIDKIRSLGFGADDYIEKPFSPAVLAARVKSQLARYERLKGTAKENTGIITIGDITLNSSTRIVTVRGENKLLPNKEFQLLEFLMINADIVFSRETIYNRIWGMESFGNTSTVPVHINRIRDAIEKDPVDPQHILTIWGVGYKFRP